MIAEKVSERIAREIHSESLALTSVLGEIYRDD